MLRNYLLIALRNLLRYKIYSAINVLGLAIGMAACLLMLLFVSHEWRFDGMHRKNVYRLDEVQQFEGMVAPQNVALSMFPMGPALNDEFPEVVNSTHLFSDEKVPLLLGDKKLYLPRALWADSSFLQVFDFPLRAGTRQTALTAPGSVVISAETARKFFGTADPIGRTLVRHGNDTLSFRVTGVLENVPPHSHLQFDALFSVYTIQKPDWITEGWGGNWVNTYLQLAERTDVAALEKKFPAFLKKYLEGEGWKYYVLFLQPLRDVHGGSTDITHDYNNYQKFDRRYTYVFAALALLVLAIASVNFMNLATARAAQRAKEVGVRKAIGAFRSQIAAQFIGESVLLAFFALLLALLLVAAGLPFVRALSERELPLSLFTSPLGVLLIGAATLLVGLLSGLYPAAFLSAFQPVRVLKGTLQGLGKKATLRNLLVVGQFAAGIFLLVGTIIASRQLRYMQERNTGFDREQVMILPLSRAAKAKYQTLKQEVLRLPAVADVTGSGQRLGNNLHQTGVKFQGDGPERSLASSQVTVDLNYLSFYKIELVAGRGFSEAFPSDPGKAYVINEALARELLKDTPGRPVASLVGKPFGFGFVDTLGTIVGVAKDFNFNSLHHKIETLCLHVRRESDHNELSVRVKPGQTAQAIRQVEATWNRLVPDRPFEYSFLDEHFGRVYRSDEQVSQVVTLLAGLAIFISCLGLFGLALYTTELRVKEIGIRKVMGASVGSLVALLSKDFLKLVVIAFLLASPVAWWALTRWLDNFAYRVEVSWWVFALAGVLALLIAWITVSFQSIKAALANPVRSLRNE
ncbi:MAG: Acidobacterial duplicated orphan permease (function unknown) [uncultured Cytophagales bacterium]|uniref:ABC transporter, permease protein n=1 Tax=uncultured Cytophagales bacterium TaxID=158755 RepID=A0A6J4IFX5_9SPHI|nr:MAG: Acidobacterial duplicated orphan permease (function unknown) [uncultured Cytophagales bacterium]